MLRMNWGASQPDEWRCSAVWWYGIETICFTSMHKWKFLVAAVNTNLVSIHNHTFCLTLYATHYFRHWHWMLGSDIKSRHLESSHMNACPTGYQAGSAVSFIASSWKLLHCRFTHCEMYLLYLFTVLHTINFTVALIHSKSIFVILHQEVSSYLFIAPTHTLTSTSCSQLLCLIIFLDLG